MSQSPSLPTSAVHLSHEHQPPTSCGHDEQLLLLPSAFLDSCCAANSLKVEGERKQLRMQFRCWVGFPHRGCGRRLICQCNNCPSMKKPGELSQAWLKRELS